MAARRWLRALTPSTAAGVGRRARRTSTRSRSPSAPRGSAGFCSVTAAWWIATASWQMGASEIRSQTPWRAAAAGMCAPRIRTQSRCVRVRSAGPCANRGLTTATGRRSMRAGAPQSSSTRIQITAAVATTCALLDKPVNEENASKYEIWASHIMFPTRAPAEMILNPELCGYQKILMSYKRALPERRALCPCTTKKIWHHPRDPGFKLR